MPFGPSPIALACLKLTTFIERSHLLTILLTLAPSPFAIKEYVSPHGIDASHDNCGYIICGLSCKDVTI